MRKDERYQAVLNWFRENMPHVETELHYTSPYELLVAVMLSAQCTDKRVNMVTPHFFMAYPTVFDLAKAKEEEIFSYIKSVSYPNSKAKHLKEMAEQLILDYKGEVPHTREELMRLKGVGRKTANVILSVLFHQATMAVDTHVFRVSKRLGLIAQDKTLYETEQDLCKNIPKEDIPDAHHWLILHGRYVCKARKPLCENCSLQSYCLHYSKNYKIKKQNN